MQGIKDPEKRVAEEVKFISQLKKEGSITNPALEKGKEFEALIEKVTLGFKIEDLEIKHFAEPEFKRETLDSVIKSIAAVVSGGRWQDKVKGEVQFDQMGDTYLLYGRVDNMKPSIIYDIKYTGRKQLNKFSSSTQHRLYMECTGIQKFSYLISNGKDWWREDYFKSMHDREFLGTIIKEMRAWISKRKDAEEAFEVKWLAH